MDLLTQKSETENAFREMAAQGPVPEYADVEFQFVPEGADADWDGLTDAFEEAGHEAEWYQGDDADDRWIEVVVGDCPVTFDAVWAYEERLSVLAAVHGFAPRGWTLFVDAQD